MALLSLLSATDVQKKFAVSVHEKRKQLKLSRPALSKISAVPAPTIKKFETTGQISLRQFILLWQCVDSLDNLVQITKSTQPKPQTINEVLN